MLTVDKYYSSWPQMCPEEQKVRLAGVQMETEVVNCAGPNIKT